MHVLNLHGPEGTAWELFVVVVVIIAAPVIVERLRIPGLIGLLVGGCIIGPEVLGIVSDTTGILHELGQVGLLYLMFLAGLELDLGVFARYRNQAIGFTALTFLGPADPRHDRRVDPRLRRRRGRSCSARCSRRTRWSPTRSCATWASPATGPSPPRSGRRC